MNAFNFKFLVLYILKGSWRISNLQNYNTQCSQQHSLYQTVMKEVSIDKPFVKSDLLSYKSHNTNSIPKQFIKNNVRQHT